MSTKKRYSAPEGADRTDVERVRAMTEADINYDDIPPLDDPVWTSARPKSQTPKRSATVRKRRAT